MKPESIKKLQENSPELLELIAFLKFEATKLNTLEGLEELEALDRQGALAGRIWAHKTIMEMLAPLIGTIEKPVGADPSEYVV